MISVKIIGDLKNCTGCGACANACHMKAISMLEDREGFLYPHIDLDKCVGCFICTNICPANALILPDGNFKKYFMVQSADVEALENSSSGGGFYEIARFILENGGYVCGAAFNEKHELRHRIISDMRDLKKLMGSKYLQSVAGSVFVDIANLLKSNRSVFFVGTPCQVAGLKSFLKSKKIDSRNLLVSDLVCHGVPSPKIWSLYLSAIVKDPISDIQFRDKSVSWRHYSLCVRNNSKILYLKDLRSDLYLRGFLSDIFLRSSCYSCKYASLSRVGDISLGDFWGCNLSFSSKGVSMVCVNSLKGMDFIEKIKNRFSIYEEKSEREILETNRVLYMPVNCPKNRDKFFKCVLSGCGIIDALKKYSMPQKNFCGNLVSAVKLLITRVLPRNLYKNEDMPPRKIGILNLSYGHFNFGAVLLSYATQIVFRRLGCHPYIINYNPQFLKYWRLSYIKGLISGFNFIKFKYSFLNTTQVFVSGKSLKKLNKYFDDFAIGSDQVWRYAICKKNYDVYFGDFVERGKNLFSYAASFGIENWSEAPTVVTAEIKVLLEKFSSISVRERSGCDILKNVFGKDGVDVLDPTMMLDRTDYLPLFCREPKRSHKYIASSFLDKTELSEFVTKECSSSFGLTVENIQYRELKIFGKSRYLYKTVSHWLSGIDNAEFVITNSFHCVAFSIILKKNFICVDSAHRGNARLKNLLEKLGLKDRLVFSKEDVEKVLQKTIDYDNVYSIIREERGYALEFLRSALKKRAS